MNQYILAEVAKPFKLGDVAVLPTFGLATVIMEFDVLCFRTIPTDGKGSLTAPLHNFPEARPLEITAIIQPYTG